MESVIAHSAEVYWEAVSIIVDENGVTENFPETDEQWEEVWSAAMSIAESGNLLMMAPRAIDSDAWMQMSAALITAGSEAAAAAVAKDPNRVLDAGEQVYNVCLACHARYIPQAE
jgi:cytochrome c5